MRRHVTIQTEVSATGREFYVVKFDRRNKWQRHWAAQFDAKHSTKDDVIAWVKKQPNFILKEDENDPA